MELKTNTSEKPKVRTEFEHSQAFWDTLDNSVNKNIPLMMEYLDMDELYGDMMPVSPIEFETSTDHIEIDTGVIETLDAFREITIEDNKEISFLLFGLKDQETGSIMLNKMGLSKMGSNAQAEFNDAQNKQLMEKIKFYKSNTQECKEAGYTPIICHGHSHPKIGISYNCFSKKDLATYVELQEI